MEFVREWNSVICMYKKIHNYYGWERGTAADEYMEYRNSDDMEGKLNIA